MRRLVRWLKMWLAELIAPAEARRLVRRMAERARRAAATERVPLMAIAITAGAGRDPEGWWPELAPLSPDERAKVRARLRAPLDGRRPGTS